MKSKTTTVRRCIFFENFTRLEPLESWQEPKEKVENAFLWCIGFAILVSHLLIVVQTVLY